MNGSLVKATALFLGIVYSVLIGFWTVGQNLQVTVFNLLLFGALWLLLKERELRLGLYHYALIALGVVISIYAAMTTNPLVVPLNYLASFVVFSYFLLALYKKEFPQTALEYLSHLLEYAMQALAFGLNLANLREFISFRNFNLGRFKIHRDYWIGFIIAIPVLLVFHMLFSDINKEYVAFIKPIFEFIWNIIEYILNIEIIWTILKAILNGYFFYSLFSVAAAESKPTQTAKSELMKVLEVVLGLTIGLFLIFSFFQSKLLLLDFTKLVFKEISLYTQNGFWQLLVVSLFGYGLSLFVLNYIHGKSTEASLLKKMLVFFTVELIVITIFSYHKLYILQSYFGFKDQRVIATFAVVLITMTFILFLFRIAEKISNSHIFKTQLMALLGVIALFNVLNIELFLTNVNPISYYVNGSKHKDFSYLLGNSYDNVSKWNDLMQEAMTKGIPTPDNYYWGNYEPICSGASRGSSSGRIYPATTYLEERYKNLEDRYKKAEKGDLRVKAQFNLHEYQTYKFLKENRGEVTKFLNFVKDTCPKNT